MLLFTASGFTTGAMVVFYALLANAVTRTRVSTRTIGIFLFFTHNRHLLLIEFNGSFTYTLKAIHFIVQSVKEIMHELRSFLRQFSAGSGQHTPGHLAQFDQILAIGGIVDAIFG